MKKRFLIFTFLLALTTITAIAQNFEGVINMHLSAEEELDVTLTLKGEDVLLETQSDKEDASIKMLMNAETSVFYVLIDQKNDKMALKSDLNSPMMKMAMQKGAAANAEEEAKNDFKIKVTSETKMIDGYKCYKVIGSSKEGEGYAWMTKELDLSLMDLFPILKSVQSQLPDKRMDAVLGIEGFVMEAYGKDAETGKEVRISNKVKKKSVSIVADNLLKGYEVLDLTDMMKLMEEAQKDPAKMEKLSKMMEKMSAN